MPLTHVRISLIFIQLLDNCSHFNIDEDCNARPGLEHFFIIC